MTVLPFSCLLLMVFAPLYHLRQVSWGKPTHPIILRYQRRFPRLIPHHYLPLLWRLPHL
jgi:hypothetical protein